MEKDFYKKLLISLITGTLVGIVVGIYQFILPYITKLSNYVFESREYRIISINVLATIALALCNFCLLKFSPCIDSSGVISIELALRKDEEIEFKKGIPTMVLNSSISTYMMMPLGSEGPSITLASKCAALVNKIFKIKDNDNVLISYGAGFGAAFISPLSGLFYSFEEGLHKFDFKLLLRSIITIIPTTLVIIFLNHHHALSFPSIYLSKSIDAVVLLTTFVFTIFVAFLFINALKYIKRFFNKYSDNFFIKNRGFILFILALVLGYTCLNFMGAGDKIIQGSLTYNSLTTIILILLFRFVITAIFGNGKVSGGLIVPSIALGALCGSFSSLIFINLGMIEDNLRAFIVLTSMCIFFTFISKAPLTGISLFLSNIAYSNKNFDIFKPIVLIAILFIVLTYFAARILRTLPLYDTLLHEQIRYLNKETQK